MDSHDRIALDHLDRITDSTGLIQHAIYCVPRRESGYTIDDNARALRLCARLWCQRPEDRMLSRVSNYLSLLEYARRPGGGFHNLMTYQRHWLDTDADGDCQGQAVRALAEVLGSTLPDDYRVLARELIEAVLPTLSDLRSIRAQAYVILAWGHLWTAGINDLEPLANVAYLAAQRLVECFHRSQRPGWQWFESRMTYANAVLPHALFIAARCWPLTHGCGLRPLAPGNPPEAEPRVKGWPKESFLEVAQASFAFLDWKTTTSAPSPLAGEGRGEGESFFWPVGNSGWYPHGEEKALYDQQPVEAATMADAALAAFSLLGDEKYLAAFHRARDWFHGRNSLGLPLVDVRAGACCDGLQLSGVNRNQGAESTLAYLLSEVHNAEVQPMLSQKRGPATADGQHATNPCGHPTPKEIENVS